MTKVYRLIPVALVLSLAMTSLAEDIPSGQDEIILRLLENEGPAAVIEHIMGYGNEDRVALFHLAREVFVFGDWSGKNLDDLVVLVDAGIEETLRQAKEVNDTPTIIALIDQANVMSFNLAADLAECWPGDTLVRYHRHFERGLSAGLQCVEWRVELEKGEYPQYLAYWVSGMHQLSLGRYQQALYTLSKALNHAQQYTIDSGLPLGLAPQVGFDLLLAHGYLGIALIMCGDTPESYEQTIDALERGIEEIPEWAGDYQFAVDQLDLVYHRIVLE
jgi:hypothetical protein